MQPNIAVIVVVFIAVFGLYIMGRKSLLPVQYYDDYNSECENIVNCKELMHAGSYFLPNPTRKLVFVIPYRDESEDHFRASHLHSMLHYTINYLIKQKTQFTMLVVNQASGKIFNKAKLLNIGFAYATQIGIDAECFIFHDVDLIAEGPDFIYYCDEKTPIHFSGYISTKNYKPNYPNIMGGVTAFTRKQFYDINGYSNSY